MRTKLRIGKELTAHQESDSTVYFENQHGMMVNGNRRIHMANWTLADLQSIVRYLEADDQTGTQTNESGKYPLNNSSRSASNPHTLDEALERDKTE